MEHGPFELAALDLPVTDLYLPGKDALIGQTQHGALFCPQIIRIVQIPDKHQIGHLFNDFQRIGQAAGPENIPKAVYFVFQFAGYHKRLPLCVQ